MRTYWRRCRPMRCGTLASVISSAHVCTARQAAPLHRQDADNYLHVAMIQLALPNAKIIDARAIPCPLFSNFKQHYARARTSVRPRRHGPFLPRLRGPMTPSTRSCRPYPPRLLERIVDDTETEVRRLNYCGLAFEPECLRFFENERPVRRRAPSSPPPITAAATTLGGITSSGSNRSGRRWNLHCPTTRTPARTDLPPLRPCDTRKPKFPLLRL